MDVQAAPPTYTPAGGVQPPSGNPPVLGQQVPGFSGGLPAQAGLSVLNNPMAGELTSTPPQPQQQTNNVNPNTEPNQAAPNAHPYPAPPQYAGGGAVQKAEQVRQMGRGEDSVLMHVTPHELKGLQALAMAHGGSLTINPHTGLPEAGLLGKLLPALIGVGLNFILPGSGLAIKGLSTAAQAGLMTGIGATAITGSLNKGLMAGLGAFGGASLAGGIQGATAGAAAPTSGAAAGSLGNVPSYGSLVMPTVPGSAAGAVTKTGLGGFMQGFANTARGGATGLLAKAAVPLAGVGLMNSLGGFSGGVKTPTGMIDNAYQGPYRYAPQEVTYKAQSPITSRDSSEHLYFANSQPELFNVSGQLVQPGSNTAPGTPILQNYLLPQGKKPKPGTPMYGQRYIPYMGDVLNQTTQFPLEMYAKGGEVQLSDGAFVVDARTVSELGNGSSGAGQELLARMGGRPVRGPGDGVSDSVPARIGRDQPARVARDEVIFSPEAVNKVGDGDQKKGAQKLYALMEKAHKARRKSARGKDTGLRKGLA